MFTRVVLLVILGVLESPLEALAQSARAEFTSPAPASTQPASDAPQFYAADPILAEYVGAALASNPGLQEALATYRSALEKVAVATALPDPIITVGQALRAVETRVGPQLQTVTLTQGFPWFGKLELRGKLAVDEAEAAYQMYRGRQRDIIAQVKRAFYNLAYVDAAIGIAREEQGLLGHYEELAQARYAAGQGLQFAVIKMQAEITRVVNRIDVLQRQRQTLSVRLNTLMNRSSDQPIPPLQAPVMPPDVPLNLRELDATGHALRPELAADVALIQRGEVGVELAQKSTRPDLSFGAAFINVGERTDPAGRLQPPPDNGKNVFTFSVGVTLPLHRDKYRADVRRAAEDLAAARLRHADARNEMEFLVREQVLRLETLREQLRLVGEVLLPQTDEALRSAESAYETGQVGVLDLLDSERSRLDVRLVQARDIADYLVALADLERVIGAPFPDAARTP